MVRMMFFISRRVTDTALIPVLLFFLFISAGYAKGEELIHIAKESLDRFIAIIPKDNIQGYGFANPSELKKAKIGDPYKVYTFTEEFLSERGNVSDDPPVFAKELRFPVLVDGKYKALLTLAETESGWKGVDFGAADLARELKSVEESRKRKAGESKILIRYYQGNCDFVVFADGSKRTLWDVIYPLSSGKVFLSQLSSDSRESFSLQDLKQLIRQPN